MTQMAEVAHCGRHEMPGSADARGVLLGPYNGSAMLRPLTEATREVPHLACSWQTRNSTASREPPSCARAARSGECNPGQEGQGNMAASGLPSPNARRLSEPIVSAEGAGREHVSGSEAQALSARAPGRSLQMQRIQALVLGLAYNLYHLRPCPA